MVNELIFFFHHIINILLTELSRSVWENLDLGRVCRPHCVRSVLTTSVKIVPYRPPARLIRAKKRGIILCVAIISAINICSISLVFLVGWHGFYDTTKASVISCKHSKGPKVSQDSKHLKKTTQNGKYIDLEA